MYDILNDGHTYRIIGCKPNPDFNECIPDFKQGQAASCAIKCQQLILRDYGIEISEDELCRIAESKGWYNPLEGTYMRNNGLLLSLFNINFTHSQHNKITNLSHEIEMGHRVMVKINTFKLYNEQDINFGFREASHAVIVDGLGFISISQNEGLAIITNPATGYVQEPRPLERFISAWDDSHNYMLATTTPALTRYNPLNKTYTYSNGIRDNQPIY